MAITIPQKASKYNQCTLNPFWLCEKADLVLSMANTYGNHSMASWRNIMQSSAGYWPGYYLAAIVNVVVFGKYWRKCNLNLYCVAQLTSQPAGWLCVSSNTVLLYLMKILSACESWPDNDCQLGYHGNVTASCRLAWL